MKVDVILVVIDDLRLIAFLKPERESTTHLGKSVEQPLVKVVGDSSAILHLAQHIPDRVPGHTFLYVHIIQVVLNELHAGREISLVELIRDIPTQRTIFSSFLCARIVFCI